MLVFTHIRDNLAAAFYPRRSEWAAGGLTVLLGWVLATNDTLMTSGTGRGYQLMLSIAEQSTWARVFIVFGALRLVILLINGAWRRSPHLRAGAAFLSCFLWTQIALSFAPTFGFAFSMASAWLALEMSNVWTAMRDARTVDDAYARRPAHDRLGQ